MAQIFLMNEAQLARMVSKKGFHVAVENRKCNRISFGLLEETGKLQN